MDASIDRLDYLAMNVQIDKEKRMENMKSEEQNVPVRAEAEPERVNAEIVYALMVASWFIYYASWYCLYRQIDKYTIKLKQIHKIFIYIVASAVKNGRAD